MHVIDEDECLPSDGVLGRDNLWGRSVVDTVSKVVKITANGGECSLPLIPLENHRISCTGEVRIVETVPKVRIGGKSVDRKGTANTNDRIWNHKRILKERINKSCEQLEETNPMLTKVTVGGEALRPRVIKLRDPQSIKNMLKDFKCEHLGRPMKLSELAEKVRKQFVWKGMYRDIRRSFKSYEGCRLNRGTASVMQHGLLGDTSGQVRQSEVERNF